MIPFYEPHINRIFIAYNNTSNHFDAHFHNSIEITYCFSGIQLIRAGGVLYELREGDAFVIFPNIVHEYIRSEGPMTETVSIICDTQLIVNNIPYLKDTYPELPLIKAEKISSDTAYAFRRITTDNDRLALLGWTYIISSDLFRHLRLKPLKYTSETNIVHRVTAYIAMNFQKPLSLELIASELGLSKSYLSHVFSDQIKIHFRTYLGTMRAEYASVLIRTTNDTLTDIAFESGFDSLRSFNRIFKMNFGMSPSSYRSSIRHI